uniref:Glycosyltransferase family 39 protein n=1 Tax=Ignavibacterium album TaxID=591197 RepID=A0A7V2ZIA5_9BACT
MNKNLQTGIISVFFIAVILRLLFFTAQNTWNSEVIENKIIPMGTDQRGYHQLAIVLLGYGKLSFNPDLPPVVLRTPGYPLFISAIYLFLGQNTWLVILIQNFLDSLTAVIIFLTISLLFNSKTGLITGILYAIEPHMILYANTFYSDTLFVFFLSLFFYYLIKFIRQSEKKYLPVIFSALFLGISVLVKPAGAYLPYIVIIVLLFYFGKSLRAGLKFSVIFFLVYLFTISPWLIRNKIHYGEFFLSNSGEYNLLAINITPMEIPKRNKPQHVVERELRMEADSLMHAEGVNPVWNKEPNDYWEGLNLQQDFNKTKYWKKVALKYIKNEPVTFAKYYILGILHTLFNLGTSEFAENLNLVKEAKSVNLKSEPNLINLIKKFFTEKSLAEILLGFFIALYLFVVYSSLLIGLIKIVKSENRFLYLVPVLFALYFILIAGAGGLARFKMPAVPFYIGISAYGSISILESFRNITLPFIKKPKR